jgi:hypothetical protein
MEMHANKLYEGLLIIHKSEDLIVKKFAYKLLVQLVTAVDGCKKLMVNDDELVTGTKEIFMNSDDDNLLEFASIILHHACDDPKRIDGFGRDENFTKSIFAKFTSHDPDVLYHSIRLLNAIMSNSMLIENILNQKDFPFKNLQIELKNDIADIQRASLESFVLISNCDAHQFVNDFMSERLIEHFYDFFEVNILFSLLSFANHPLNF